LRGDNMDLNEIISSSINPKKFKVVCQLCGKCDEIDLTKDDEDFVQIFCSIEVDGKEKNFEVWLCFDCYDKLLDGC